MNVESNNYLYQDSPLCQLPQEILLHVFTQIFKENLANNQPIEDLKNLYLTCKQFRNLSDSYTKEFLEKPIPFSHLLGTRPSQNAYYSSEQIMSKLQQFGSTHLHLESPRQTFKGDPIPGVKELTVSEENLHLFLLNFFPDLEKIHITTSKFFTSQSIRPFPKIKEYSCNFQGDSFHKEIASTMFPNATKVHLEFDKLLGFSTIENVDETFDNVEDLSVKFKEPLFTHIPTCFLRHLPREFPSVKNLSVISDVSIETFPAEQIENLVSLNFQSPYPNTEDFKNLTNLTSLRISDESSDGIADIEDLSNLHKLQSLTLERFDSIENEESFAKLTSLQSLTLKENSLKSLLPLSQLTDLKELHLLGEDSIDKASLSCLKNLKNLESFSFTSYREDSDSDILDILPSFPKLKNLTINDVTISGEFEVQEYIRAHSCQEPPLKKRRYN